MTTFIIPSEITILDRLASIYPDSRTWRGEISRGVRSAIVALVADRTDEEIASVSDTDAAQRIVTWLEVNTGMRSGNSYLTAFTMLVAWLRTQQVYFKPEGEVVGLAYPEAPHDLIKYHEAALGRLRLWADNGIDDVKDGVDAQAVHLTGMAQDGDLWPTDSCATDADAKDFLGGVMRYKTAKNAGVVSIDEVAVPPIGEPIVAVEVLVEKTELDLMRERAERAEALAQKRLDNHIADNAAIGTRFWEEARRRSWCSEAQGVISDLNCELNVELEEQEEEYGCWVNDTITVNVRRFYTGEHNSAEDAEESAREWDIDTSDIVEAVRNGEWTVDGCEVEDAEVQ